MECCLGQAVACRQQLAVGGKGHCGGAVLGGMIGASAQQTAERPLDRNSFPAIQFLACRGVPDKDRRIPPAPRDDTLTIGREGKAVRLVSVAAKGLLLLAAGELPEANDALPPRGERLAVRR